MGEYRWLAVVLSMRAALWMELARQQDDLEYQESLTARADRMMQWASEHLQDEKEGYG